MAQYSPGDDGDSCEEMAFTVGTSFHDVVIRGFPTATATRRELELVLTGSVRPSAAQGAATGSSASYAIFVPVSSSVFRSLKIQLHPPAPISENLADTAEAIVGAPVNS